MWNFINRLGTRRDIGQQNLPTAFREFIQEFEHSTERMCQVLHSRPGTSDSDPDVEKIHRWCDLVFRLATYALVSSWIDDKTEERVTNIRTTMNLTTGQTTKEEEHRTTKAMHVPKRYRRATKDI